MRIRQRAFSGTVLVVRVWPSILVGLSACGAEHRLVVGDVPDSGRDYRDDGGPGEEGDDAPDASGSGLAIRFRAAGQTVSDVLELACGQECVEVEATVQGGTPPYELRWGDGVTGAKRDVCAGEGPYAINVDDSGDPEGEFGVTRLHAEATLSLRQDICSDAGVPTRCRVVSMGTKSADCGAEDSYAELDATLRAGQRYEFRYELSLIGFGSFGVYASDTQCVGVGPELGRVEYAEGLVIGGARSSRYTCQTLAHDTKSLFFDQSEKVWGGAIFDAITVCEGCPSEGQ